MTQHIKKYKQIFDYLSADESPSSRESGLIVFGRKDLLVARKAIDIVKATDTPWVIVTGGVGKDSGDLAIPEAVYLAQEMDRQGNEQNINLPSTYLDTEATNGGENTRNSLSIVRNNQLDTTSGVTTVAHATSSRRLAETMKHTAATQENPLKVYRLSSGYQFKPENPADQAEARAELLRLADWPQKNWLLPQDDLPENLVDFARDVQSRDQ